MKERPILFSGEMVRAILAGRKTQTRRIVKPQPNSDGLADDSEPQEYGYAWRGTDGSVRQCPYGRVGDRLWVKETHRHPSKENPRVRVEYRADMSSWGIADSHNVATNEVTIDAKLFPGRANEYSKQHWRPSIFMHRWASRITVEITGVRVERLNEINKEDAIAEGLTPITKDDGRTIKWGIPDRDGMPGTDDDGWPWTEWNSDPRVAYRNLWERINGVGSWAASPWVWIVDFRRIAA